MCVLLVIIVFMKRGDYEMKTTTKKQGAVLLAVLLVFTVLAPGRVHADEKGKETALSHVTNDNARENVQREGGKALGKVKHGNDGDTSGDVSGD